MEVEISDSDDSDERKKKSDNNGISNFNIIIITLLFPL